MEWVTEQHGFAWYGFPECCEQLLIHSRNTLVIWSLMWLISFERASGVAACSSYTSPGFVFCEMKLMALATDLARKRKCREITAVLPCPGENLRHTQRRWTTEAEKNHLSSPFLVVSPLELCALWQWLFLVGSIDWHFDLIFPGHNSGPIFYFSAAPHFSM